MPSGRTREPTVRLEPEFWSAFDEVAEGRGITLNELARATLPRHGESRTSVLRL